MVERGCGHRGCVGGDGRRGGIAAAETGSPGSDAKGTTSAESTKSTESKADSHKEGASTPNPNPSGKKPKKDAPADPKGANETDAAQQDDEDKIVDETEPPARQPDEQPTATAKDAEPAGSDTAAKLADQPVNPAAIERKPAAKPAAKQEVEEPTPQESTESTETTLEPAVATVVPTSRNAKTAATPKTAAPQTVSVAFAAPANAEQTNSIVVAPSITSNFFSSRSNSFRASRGRRTSRRLRS